MKNLDFYFHYKYVLRLLLVQKLGYIYKHPYFIPKVTEINMFFSIKDLVDYDHLKGSNFFFFFKYFFGKNAFFFNYFSRFSLNVLYHNFEILLKLKKKDMYYCFSFLLYDILPFCKKQYYILNLQKKNYIKYKIFDMNIFLEKKTHIGFFNLKDGLNLKFYSSGIYNEKTFLFQMFKLKC
jgi:hypothetical protein